MRQCGGDGEVYVKQRWSIDGILMELLPSSCPTLAKCLPQAAAYTSHTRQRRNASLASAGMPPSREPLLLALASRGEGLQ